MAQLFNIVFTLCIAFTILFVNLATSSPAVQLKVCAKKKNINYLILLLF